MPHTYRLSHLLRTHLLSLSLCNPAPHRTRLRSCTCSTAATCPSLTQLTMAFWADLADANDRMAFWFGRPDGTQNRIMVKANSVTLDFSGQPMMTATVPSLLGNWHHILLSYDGATRLLYVDGVEVRRDAIAANTLNTLPVGLFVAGGIGALDDLRVYRYALQPNEVRALAATGWRMANMVNAAALSAESTWSAGVPAGLEGFYELQTRGFDALGNFDKQARELLTIEGGGG